MRIEQLAAHLKAYVDTLPTITTLRLCNRFGTGNDCHVNRLPVELVNLIEEHIVGQEREAALETYSKALRCCEGRCEQLSDHITQEELYEEYHLRRGCLDNKCAHCSRYSRQYHIDCKNGACDGDKCPVWKYDHDLDLEVLKQLEQRANFNEVQDRCCASQDLSIDLPIAEEQHQLLKTHFGISVTPKCWRPKGMSKENFTCAAYLTLPGNIVREEEWEPSNLGPECLGFGMPVEIGAPPTAQSLSRFPRALRILGLEAWSHPSLRKKLILSPPVAGEEETEIDGMDVVQPRLTFLVSTY